MPLAVPDHVLTVPRETVSGFFLTFARIEFALKASGFVRNGRYGAEPDWGRFGRTFGPHFQPEEPDLIAATTYLLRSPPKRQYFHRGRIDWQDRIPPEGLCQLELVIFHVKGVRNNLFHGAKFLARENADPERDAKLIDASSKVLEACLRLAPQTLHAFESEVLA